MVQHDHGFIPYAYDPLLDFDDDLEADAMHDPKVPLIQERQVSNPWRGLANVTTLIILVVALLCLFIVYPAVVFSKDTGRADMIAGNKRINSTGQAVDEDIPVERRSIRVWYVFPSSLKHPQC